MPNTAPSIEWSIVIPAYNEAARIGPYLQRVTTYMRDRGYFFEVLVVDDGSTDATATIVTALADSLREIHLLRAPQHQGKGASVRQGMQAAVGRWQLFADADGATPIEELSRLEAALMNGADLAIGSRTLAAQLPHYTVKARWHRTVFGAFFNFIVQQSGLRGITDTQCGFKLFRQAVAQELFAISTITGYGFDLELLFIAQQRGYRIAEVPVNWTDQPGSKVRPLRDGFAMLYELVLIRRNSRAGAYARSGGAPTPHATSPTESPSFSASHKHILPPH